MSVVPPDCELTCFFTLGHAHTEGPLTSKAGPPKKQIKIMKPQEGWPSICNLESFHILLWLLSTGTRHWQKSNGESYRENTCEEARVKSSLGPWERHRAEGPSLWPKFGTTVNHIGTRVASLLDFRYDEGSGPKQ